MSEIDEEQIRKWGLVYSDLISTKLKLNVTFKNFSGEEILYNELLQKMENQNGLHFAKKKQIIKRLLLQSITFQFLVVPTVFCRPALLDKPFQTCYHLAKNSLQMNYQMKFYPHFQITTGY